MMKKAVEADRIQVAVNAELGLESSKWSTRSGEVHFGYIAGLTAIGIGIHASSSGNLSGRLLIFLGVALFVATVISHRAFRRSMCLSMVLKEATQNGPDARALVKVARSQLPLEAPETPIEEGV